ncbi:Virulence factor MVIN superfamily [Verrucomicrobiia bacterium DG1235]|nr:Virulence factor MVIN superfamily [Verrucomicrobiae bacterium DG1235]
MDSSQFKKITTSSLRWNTLSQFLSQAISLVIGIILARRLSPEEFGVVGMVVVLTGFANIFVNFGLASAIIQRKNTSDKHLSSVFWINIFASLLMSVTMSLCAPLVSKFYSNPSLTSVTIAIAWTLFLQSFTMVQNALLRRKMNFKRITFITNISSLVAGTAAIICAYLGFSYWSIIIQSYVAILVTAAFLWLSSSWRPAFLFEKDSIKELLNFTLPLVGTEILNYWRRNADYLLIGKILGDSALGIYTRAYTLMLKPISNVSRVISSVMFPAYSAIQDDKDKIKRIYLRITRLIAFLTFPAMFGLLAVSESFIMVLLGEKWEAAIPILKILAPIGAIQSLSTLNGNIFLSQGATKLQFHVGIYTKSFAIIMMFIGLLLGELKGLASFYLIASIVNYFILYHFMGGLINLKLREILLNIYKYFISSVIMASVVIIIHDYLLVEFSYFHRLSASMLTGILTYTALALALGAKEHKELLILFRRNSAESKPAQ